MVHRRVRSFVSLSLWTLLLAAPAAEHRGKLTRWTFLAAVLLCVLLAPASQANADQITTFEATGTFADTSLLSGTVTIDTTTDGLLAIDLNIGTPASLAFTTTTGDLLYSNDGELVLLAFGTNSTLVLDVPVPSLVDYTSGPLGTSAANTHTYYAAGTSEYTPIDLTSGDLTAVSAPEPASITLLASGILAAGGFHFVRRRRKASESSPLG
jgi:hypothetical protein